MRIAKAVFIQPERNGVYGAAAVALSFFVFAYSARFGQISILAYYGVWLPLVLLDYRNVLGNPLRMLWIFAFAIFCFISVFWSPAASVSLRAAIQYLSHIVCAVIALRTITIATLTRGATLGCAVVLLYSLLFGSYHFDPLDGTYSFVGAFASKNQLGFYASLGLIFSYAGMAVIRSGLRWLPVAGGTTLLSAYSLFASQSATSVITTLAILMLIAGLQLLGRFTPNMRKLLFASGLVVGVIGVTLALGMGAADAVLGAFGKDSTLTGRTYLWQQGIEAARQSPVLGIGYQGYWVRGFPEAERLWQEFYIDSRGGFHFHNTYIETMVETGAIGMLLLCTTLITSFIGHLKHLLHDRKNPESLVMFAVISLLLVRSFVEIDVMYPYQVGSFLFYITAGTLTLRKKARSRAISRPMRIRPMMTQAIG
ncbi:O-antigen ligase family protein [Rhizobium sp. SL86]|uniref:O-antigen ligase family protein n=1 Tax=Rhizobium sp. SL86 TaxID=2995148 RepID=UPI002273C80C|nr:O-antigen ligase [Rhizobium sp. SL86]MCY1665887.1 O-antigen ligase [Rhizobium sp. SL86]